MVLVRIPAAFLPGYTSHRKASSPMERRATVDAEKRKNTAPNTPPVADAAAVLNAGFYSFLCFSRSPRAEIVIVRDGKASERLENGFPARASPRPIAPKYINIFLIKRSRETTVPLKTEKKNATNLISVPFGDTREKDMIA